MKKLEFKTSKGEFVLVDLSEVEAASYFINVNANSIIGNVKGMSEEQFAEVVNSDDDYGVTMFQNYATTSMAYFDEQINAEQSFTSLIHSLGWYLWENPIKLPYSMTYCSSRWSYYGNEVLQWRQAESKTLYSPILLKKI